MLIHPILSLHIFRKETLWSPGPVRLKILVIAIALAVFTSCLKDEEAPPAYQPEILLDAVLEKNLSRDDVSALMAQGGFYPPGTELFVRYGVEAYSITYQTVSWDGEPVIASGALLIPKTTETFPLLAFQHGTLSSPLEAPSLFQSLYTDQAAVFAASGFIMALPDFLGYGASDHLDHPYEHRQTLATATRDMIRAAREFFLVERRDGLSDQLFLAGYSEGGFATLAALKLLQEEHAEEFTVTAATAGAGAYNKTETFRQIVMADMELPHINLYLWVLDVYNRIYPQLGRPLIQYLNEPWASQVAQQGVFSPVEQNPSVLLKPAFIEGILSGSDTAFLSVLADNDVYDWRPSMPLKLYHGTADVLVPFLNSQTAYAAMTAQGAAGVVFEPIVGGTHETSFLNYIIGTFGYFFSLRD
jgi:pimeloyl-ACP methyl ester carboxylesterase